MIITNNEAALRVKCEDVLPEEVGDLIAKLESELNYANRLGKGVWFSGTSNWNSKKYCYHSIR